MASFLDSVMKQQTLLFISPLIASGLCTAGLGAYIWLRRGTRPEARRLAILMLAVAVWSLVYSLELANSDLAAKLFWAKFKYVGQVVVAPAWLLFSLEYSGRKKWLTERHVALLTILSVSALLMIWSNDIHHLFWTSASVYSSGSFSTLFLRVGIGFWLWAAYCYTLMLVGSFAIVDIFIRSRRPYRVQAGIMVLGAATPWLCNILFLAGLSPFPHLDLTPFGFVITCFLCALGLFRFRLLSMVPVAHEAIIDSMSDAVVVFDDENRLVDLNPAAECLIGHGASEAIGRSATELSAGLPERFEFFDRETSSHHEIVLGTEGHQRTYEARTSYQTDAKGVPVYKVIVFHDITDRKQTEEALREADKRYRLLAQNVSDVIWTMDLQSLRFTFVSPSGSRLRGYTSSEVMVQSMEDVLTPESLAVAMEVLQEELSRESTEDGRFPRSRTLELEQIRRDGTTVWTEVTVTFMRDADGKPTELLGVTRDITERKQVQDDLRESEERYRTLVDSSLTGIYVRDAERILFANKRTVDMTGYTMRELSKMSFLDMIHPDDVEIARDRAVQRMLGKGPRSYSEYRMVTKSGDIRWVEAFGMPIIYNGRPAVLGNLNDITERRQAEAQMRLSEEKYRALFEESKDTVYLSSPDGGFLDINPAGIDMFGYSSREELLKINLSRDLYVNPEERKAFQRAIAKNGFVKDYELSLRRKDGRQLNILVTANAVHDSDGWIVAYRGIMRDVTEQKKLEQQLLQAQKMESIGTLAGGIAHDFNNILGGILGYASFMKSKIGPGHPFFRYLDTIERSSTRAAELTSQLLGFARRGRYDSKPLNLNKAIKETLSIIERTIDKSIGIETHLRESVPAIEADGGQLQQVLMNLFINAADAMPAGGRLTVGTDVETLGEEYVRTHMGAKAGTYVRLSVSDTGIGMDRETQERIFEPFFTTKKNGKGTGLGLSMVYGVVKNHGGYITVDTEPGHGTTFKVYLPASEKRLTDTVLKSPITSGRGELILVVDDEEAIRVLAKDVLESNGYRVILAEDGAQAVRICEEFDGEISLVLLDMVMPNMGGLATYLKIKAVNPDVRALLSSGYSQDGKAQEILDSGVRGFLQKPYQLSELLSRVRNVIDAEA